MILFPSSTYVPFAVQVGFRRDMKLTWKLPKGFRYDGVKINSVFRKASLPE